MTEKSSLADKLSATVDPDSWLPVVFVILLPSPSTNYVVMYFTNYVREYYSQSILSDAIITLANAFKEAGYNPPNKVEVDSQTFDKQLSESMKLYNIDSKKAIIERKLSIADVITIIENSDNSN